MIIIFENGEATVVASWPFAHEYFAGTYAYGSDFTIPWSIVEDTGEGLRWADIEEDVVPSELKVQLLLLGG